MANKSDSTLRFSIEESVWLRNGQEVSEVLSMSLNPEISIEEIGEQIEMKGFLYLSGEYRSTRESEDEENIEEDSPLTDQLQFRTMEQITNADDGVLELEHRFPVDITIPKQRIQDVDDIYVNVETFDYDLPSKNCIELTADIAITGIVQDEVRATKEENEEEETRQTEEVVEEMIPQLIGGGEEEPQENSFAEFEFEARKVQEDDDEVEQEEKAELEDDRVQEEKIENEQPSFQPPILEMKSRDDSKREQSKSTEQAAQEESFISPLKSISVNEQQEEKVLDDEVEDVNSINDLQDREEIDSTSREREENALYLTSILSREEEEFSKLKMCIIQPGESLDEIASKYEVSASHLVRVNRLDHEEVEEGQILYIPISAGRS